jgi:hypothetical protein
MDVYLALHCFLLDMSDLQSYTVSSNASVLIELYKTPFGPEPECFHVNDDTRVCRVSGQAMDGECRCVHMAGTNGPCPQANDHTSQI